MGRALVLCLRGKGYTEKSGFDLLKLVERNVTKEIYALKDLEHRV